MPQAYAGERPRLSVVVVTWNERAELARCLDLLAADAVPGGQEVIVVDNGSTDGTGALLAARPDVRVVRNPANDGVTSARNQGMRIARGRHIAILDSDAYVRPGALEALSRFLDENPEVGMVGPRLVYEDGSLQFSCRRIPSVMGVVANRLERFDAMRAHASRRRYLMLDEPHDRTMEVEYLLGAAMVVRREAVRAVGGFDERVPYGFMDDADWALRFREHGWKVVYEPSATIVHGYRRRTATRPVSRQGLSLAASYALLRLKHRGRLRPGGRA